MTSVTSPVMKRDYSLTGSESARARDRGLADSEWYRPAIDPERLRGLTRRTNGRATVDTSLWIALLVATGTAGWFALGTWQAVPAFAAYGALYGGSADARWHEMGHGTAFRTRWINDAVYYLASFMIMRGPTLWRWSHARHHTDTIIVGRDAEIAAPRPTSRLQIVGLFLGYGNVTGNFVRTFRHAAGRLDDDARDFVPRSEWSRVVLEARGYVVIWGAVVLVAAGTTSFVPLLYVILPSFYGVWLGVFFGLTQHAGLREDVLDHRLNTRTVHMNPVFRFLNLNMNYHVEHHIFPTVPYPALPALHREIGAQLAPPTRTSWQAYRELLSAVRRQHDDPSWEIPDRPVPADPAQRRHRIDAGTDRWSAVTDGSVDATAHGVDLGPLDQMTIGVARRVDVGADTFVVCRTDADTVYLLDGVCSHGHAHLADGLVLGCEIECPKHNGRFDLRTGEATRRPAAQAIRVHAVEITNGRVRAMVAGAEHEHPEAPQ